MLLRLAVCIFSSQEILCNGQARLAEDVSDTVPYHSPAVPQVGVPPYTLLLRSSLI